MKKLTIFVVILLILCLGILILKKYTNESIKLPITDCEKVEILTVPMSEDYNNSKILTDEKDIEEYINCCNNIRVKKTNDYFFESTDVDIRLHYKNGDCYQLECNSYSSSGLLSVSKIIFSDNRSQIVEKVEFFYTNEIDKLITY